jgi:hypothetical protein
MATQLFANNATSLLASSITDVATSLTVTTGHGARFPTITGSDYFLATLCQISGVDEVNFEIVKVTARSTDTFTIVRAQEGTTGLAYNAGDKVELRLTKGTMEGVEATSSKDATGGYAGLTLFKLNLKNAANTFTNFFTSATTAARTWTMQDRDGTIADDTDLATKAALAGSAAQAFSMTTATQGTNTTQGASTAFVINEFGKHKNLIIGGDFTTNPWQRGTTFTALGNGSYGADRFFSHLTTAGVVDVLKSADAPTAAAAGVYAVSCLTLDVTTVDASIAAGDYYITTQNIEGLNSLSLGFGQAGTRYCTLSFWHKHTKTGTYCIGVTNSANDRSYVAEYTQDVTNTWEKATLTIPVDTSGTWLYTSGLGLRVRFVVMSGSTFQTTANTWAAGNYLATSNQVNALDSTSNFCKFALIQLEAGSVATQFETRSAGEELALCQRYYEKSYPQGTAVRTNATNLGLPFFYASAVIATGSNVGYVGFKVTKRDTPTITTYSYTSSTSGALSTAGGTDLAASSATTTGIGDNGFSVRNTSGGNITPATGGFIVHWAASIEL